MLKGRRELAQPVKQIGVAEPSCREKLPHSEVWGPADCASRCLAELNPTPDARGLHILWKR